MTRTPPPPPRPTLLGQTDPRLLDRLPQAAPRPRTTFNSAV
jgi:hypothetical protein